MIGCWVASANSDPESVIRAKVDCLSAGMLPGHHLPNCLKVTWGRMNKTSFL